MLIIIASILVGLFISLITLPLGYYAPEWMLLIVTYWALAVPSNNKLFLAFLTGIIVDIVFGQVLGISSLFYVMLIYFILRLYNSLRYMTVAQQAVVLLILFLIKQHLFIWAYYIMDKSFDYQALLIGVISTSIFWPLAFYSLRFIRRKFQVKSTA